MPGTARDVHALTGGLSRVSASPCTYWMITPSAPLGGVFRTKIRIGGDG